MSDNPNRISLNPTIARQTPKNEFGNVLKSALQQGAQLAGGLLNSVPGGGIISAAIGNVTAVASGGNRGASSASLAATGVISVPGQGVTSPANAGGGTISNAVASNSGEVPSSMTGYLDQMRAEADRSMMMQMQMQQESREYNTLSNVIKVRHDSAKAAINNIH